MYVYMERPQCSAMQRRRYRLFTVINRRRLRHPCRCDRSCIRGRGRGRGEGEGKGGRCATTNVRSFVADRVSERARRRGCTIGDGTAALPPRPCARNRCIYIISPVQNYPWRQVNSVCDRSRNLARRDLPRAQIGATIPITLSSLPACQHSINPPSFPLSSSSSLYDTAVRENRQSTRRSIRTARVMKLMEYVAGVELSRRDRGRCVFASNE